MWAVTTDDVAAWASVFIATAGAAAALAGLVFVAVSINITRILALAGVPERGLQTVLVLLGAVVVSVFALVPQTVGALGIEIVVTGSALTLWIAGSMRTTLVGTRGHPRWVLSRTIATVPSGLAYVVGGIALIAGADGLAWLLAGIIAALVGAVINAWVLLVEILR